MVKKYGMIPTWVAKRGFGFIHSVGEDGEVISYFCHISEVMGVPYAGATCRFVGKETQKGLQAVHVEILSPATPTSGLNALADKAVQS